MQMIVKTQQKRKIFLTKEGYTLSQRRIQIRTLASVTTAPLKRIEVSLENTFQNIEYFQHHFESLHGKIGFLNGTDISTTYMLLMMNHSVESNSNHFTPTQNISSIFWINNMIDYILETANFSKMGEGSRCTSGKFNANNY